MFKLIKQKLILKRNKKILKEFFEPRKEFLDNSRSLFLNALSEKTGFVPSAELPTHPFFYKQILRYGISFAAILLFLGTGAAAYAEKRDVDPSHPLYPAKRLGEKIQLNLAPKSGKTVLYEKYAERRVDEIKKIEKISESGKASQKIENIEEIKSELKNDLRIKVEGVENNIREENFIREEKVKEKVINLCETEWSEIMNKEEMEIFWKKSGKMWDFKKRCEKLKEEKEIDNRGKNNEEIKGATINAIDGKNLIPSESSGDNSGRGGNGRKEFNNFLDSSGPGSAINRNTEINQKEQESDDDNSGKNSDSGNLDLKNGGDNNDKGKSGEN